MYGDQRLRQKTDGRPRTWLESVEANISELEIVSVRDVHDRIKWNVMKRKSNPIRKRTIKR